MKLTLLSKSVRAIGLTAMLSVMVATTLQQPIQAQSKGNKVPTTADGTCAPLPEGTYYKEYGGITFSSEQKAAYQKSMAKVKKRFAALNAAIERINIYYPNAGHIAAGQQIGLDFEAEMMSAFTPEQQKIYRTNLAIQRQIQACVPPTPWAKIMSPDPF
jgi:hypothetical protein